MKLSEIMKRSKFFKHQDSMILKFDLSGIDSEENFSKVVDYFSQMVHMMPKKSIFGLVDVTSLVVTDRIRQALDQLTERCNPYFRRTAIVARDAATEVRFHEALKRQGKVKVRAFGDDETAKTWLVS